MTLFEALPSDIDTALYHYCKDDECLNDAVLRALRAELKPDKVKHNKYSHDCFRCDKFKEYRSEVTAQIEKMKCCMNCKFYDFDEPKYCHKGVFGAYICDKWELNEEEMKWQTESN